MFINIRRRGYWGSYNRAFYKDAFEASGAANMTELYGDYFSYKNTARAKVVQLFIILFNYYNYFQFAPYSFVETYENYRFFRD